MSERPSGPDAARISALAADLRVLLGKFRRRLREQSHLGDLNLTESQISVLRRLDSDGPATVTTLAKAEGIRPQSMGANVAALEAAGLVSGSPDPNDGRQTLLSLTAECRERVKAGRAARQDWLFRAIQANLSSKEQRELASALELLYRLINQEK
jgi:DNA-binding MarR family transcriptional regulator